MQRSRELTLERTLSLSLSLLYLSSLLDSQLPSFKFRIPISHLTSGSVAAPRLIEEALFFLSSQYEHRHLIVLCLFPARSSSSPTEMLAHRHQRRLFTSIIQFKVDQIPVLVDWSGFEEESDRNILRSICIFLLRVWCPWVRCLRPLGHSRFISHLLSGFSLFYDKFLGIPYLVVWPLCMVGVKLPIKFQLDIHH